MSRAWLSVLILGCSPSDPAGPPQPAVPDVEIVAVDTLRDLVAVTDHPDPAFTWTSTGTGTAVGERVPAELLWPGDTWTVTALFADGTEASDSLTVPEPPGGNVLVILIDDVGVDKVSAYGHPASPETPTLDSLADEGVRFTRAYTSPVCSPTRGILLTGRHARRTGMGWIADTGDRDYALPLESLTLPEALWGARSAEPWSDAAIGKWHLAGPDHPDVLSHPNDSGFDWFSGLVGNPMYAEGLGYDAWEHNDNGVLTQRSGYLTTATIDDALVRIDVMPEPWFLYLPLNAAHGPWTRPPDDLLAEPLPDDPTDLEAFDAVLAAMDLELGRMLDSIDPDVLARTTIVVMGDNGTPEKSVDESLDPAHQKHTMYEGGVNVPLIVTGPLVAEPGTTADALVHVADIFPTVAEIAGVPLGGDDDALYVAGDDGPVPLDGRSWLPFLADPTTPGPELLFAEAFFPNGPGPDYGINRRMLRDDRYKLIRAGDDVLMFDLLAPDPAPDGPDLLDAPLSTEADLAYTRLSAALDLLEQSLVFEGY